MSNSSPTTRIPRVELLYFCSRSLGTAIQSVRTDEDYEYAMKPSLPYLIFMPKLKVPLDSPEVVHQLQ